jgi:tRNA-dihydrouridine synthase C
MKLILAPMEGLLDFTLRDILTRVGGVDRCVSEFIRITDQLLPARVFTRIVPELRHGSRTPAGVPVRPQLLGSDPSCMAENAALLATLGPAGIDLNFGCPAKTVNQHRGGAVLLDEPELVGRIVAAVRRAVPASIPVSAKMRLGNRCDGPALDCARAIDEAGADELVVHARTRVQGYRPPAYWERIHEVRAAVRLPVIANGEIWTVQDAWRCRELTGCDTLMIGRGLVRNPGLALAITAADRVARGAPAGAGGIAWNDLLPLIGDFWRQIATRVEPRHRSGRLKQWLNYLRGHYPEAEQAFAELRLSNDPASASRWLTAQLAPVHEALA